MSEDDTSRNAGLFTYSHPSQDLEQHLSHPYMCTVGIIDVHDEVHILRLQS